MISVFRKTLALAALSLALSGAGALAAPIKALLVTGGCCHDYGTQKEIIPEGLNAFVDEEIDWTVVHQGGNSTSSKIELYEDADWAKGFDIVIHNECFADVKEQDWLSTILKPHREGLPGIVIHCAMHSYRVDSEAWFEFCGVTSHRHGAHYPFEVRNLKPDHPIMEGFGDSWKTPQGELYLISKVWPNATPLAHARSRDTDKDEVCVWTNRYGENKTRVFGTTIGHHNATMQHPKYLEMLSRGFLWALGKDEAAELETPLVPKNIATGGEAFSGSHQDGHPPEHAIDGSMSTRWCAPNADTGYHFGVDLGEVQPLTGVKIVWESNNNYQYLLEGSQDGETYHTLVDYRDFREAKRTHTHTWDALKHMRHLKVTVTGLDEGRWASIWEFQVFGTEMEDARVAAEREKRKLLEGRLSGVKVPEGFEVRPYGFPPEVNYPVIVATAPEGDLFVSVDKNSSLGKDPDRGSILRLRDSDNDGTADEIRAFVESIDSPRGLHWADDTLYVLHPPDLSAFKDTDGDGVADEKKVLVKGIGWDLEGRPADHASNDIRLAIDGWIYCAIGDFGFMKAVGTDGAELQLRGGGVVRVRPDGTELELYARGTRNIYDVNIDPLMNIFTRDNTNDGGGWDVRLSHIIQLAEYGYPSLYKNFTEEIMPPLADYGGGSGTGGMYLQEPGWPEGYGDTLYTVDWGRNAIYRHPLEKDGATFDAEQDTFISLPRPTDMDVDGSGRLYVASWEGGQYQYKDENVGYIVQVVPKGHEYEPFPNLAEASEAALLDHLTSDSATLRLYAQRELIRRQPDKNFGQRLFQAAADEDLHLYGRVAAMYTLKELYGQDANADLIRLAEIDALRRSALRILADRKGQLGNVPEDLFVEALGEDSPRVRMQALIGLARLDRPEVAGAILPFTQSDSSVISHIAVKALVRLGADNVLLAHLVQPGSEYSEGALAALKHMHNRNVVEGLGDILASTEDEDLRRAVVTALIRLYHREGEWEGESWGTRPDTTGPYYKRAKWELSDRIERLLRPAFRSGDFETLQFAVDQLRRHRVELANMPSKDLLETKRQENDRQAVKMIQDALARAGSDRSGIIAHMDQGKAAEATLAIKGDPAKGERIFTAQACAVCHATSQNQTPVGPYLGDIANRYSRAEIIESVLNPSAVVAQGFGTNMFTLNNGDTALGFVTREAGDEVEIRDITGASRVIKKDDIKARTELPSSMMPPGLANGLTAEEFASLLAYLESLVGK